MPARNKCHQKAIRFLFRSVDVIYKLWYNLLLLFVASIVGYPLDTRWEWECCFDFHAHLISTFPFPLAFRTQNILQFFRPNSAAFPLPAVCLLLLLQKWARTHRPHRLYQFQGERIRQTMNTLTSSIANSYGKQRKWCIYNQKYFWFWFMAANKSCIYVFLPTESKSFIILNGERVFQCEYSHVHLSKSNGLSLRLNCHFSLVAEWKRPNS